MSESSSPVVPTLTIPGDGTIQGIESIPLHDELLSSTPDMNGRATPSLHEDIQREIENLKTARKEKGGARADAKRLQNEIDQQFDLSFELMEQRQNAVKEYLRKRELEEEEFKKRAAQIAQRHQDEIDDVATAKRNRPAKDRDSWLNKTATVASQTEGNETTRDREGDFTEGFTQTDEIEAKTQDVQTDFDQTEFDAVDTKNRIDSQTENDKLTDGQKRVSTAGSTQTDEIEVKTQDVQTDLDQHEFDTVSAKSRFSENDLNPDDIPDVIEAITSDLLQKMKRKLAKEKDKVAGEAKGLTAKENDVKDEKNNAKGTVDTSVIGSEDWPKELANSLINNRINNTGIPLDVKDDIVQNKDELVDALVRDIEDVDDISNIPENATENLADTYREIKDDFDNLKKMLDTDRERAGPAIENKVEECRKLCHDIDDVENSIKLIDDAIKTQLRTGGCIDQMTGIKEKEQVNDNIMDNNEQNRLIRETSEEDPSIQVAELQTNDEMKTNNELGGNGDLSTPVGDSTKLPELINKKIDAEIQLDAKLDELANILLGNSADSLKAEDKIPGIESDELKEAGDRLRDDEAGRLKAENKVLQQEIERILEGSEELRKKCEILKSKAKEDNMKNTMDIIDVVGEEIDIPKWENENKLKEQLNAIKDRLGDELFNDLIGDTASKEHVIETLKASDYFVLEDKKIDNAMQDYEQDIKKLSDQLTDEQVANKINELTKIDNPNVDVVMEKLQNEAMRTGQALEENNEEIGKLGEKLQELVDEKRNLNDEYMNLKDERRSLEMQLAEINNDICRCFPIIDTSEELQAIENSMKDIDKEIEVLAREVSDDGIKNEAGTKELSELKRLLEKLRPHVNKEVMASYKGDDGEFVTKRGLVPSEVQVNDAVELKNNVVQEMRRFQGVQNLDDREVKPHNKDSKEATRMDTGLEDRNIEDLKKELLMINKSLEESEIKDSDKESLEEVIESLRSTLEEIDGHIASMNADASGKENGSLRNDIDAEIAQLKEELKDVETYTTDQDDITILNAKDKIKVANDNLLQEKERLQELIDNAKEFKRDTQDKEGSDIVELKKLYQEENDRIKRNIEYCLDDTIDLIEYLKDQVQKIKTGTESDDDLEAGYPEQRWRELNEEIRKLKSDLELLTADEQDRSSVEFYDPDVEELLIKLEALEVSQERMDTGIKEHLESDGDPNMLELLLKKKQDLSDNVLMCKEHLKRAENEMIEKLGDLEKERDLIEDELLGESGRDMKEKQRNKEAMIEMLGKGIGKQGSIFESEEDFDPKKLKDLLINRQNAFEEIENMDENLEETSQEDIDILWSHVKSTFQDIEERIRGMDDLNTTELFGDDIDMKHVNDVLQQREELINALDYIENCMKEEEIKAKSQEDKMHHVEVLETLAERKIDAINRKLERIEELDGKISLGAEEEEELRIKGNKDDILEGIYDKNVHTEYEKSDEGQLLAEIKEALGSLVYINSDKDIFDELNAKTLEDIQLRNERDKKISLLFDKRDGILKEYLEHKNEDFEQRGGNLMLGLEKQVEDVEELILLHPVTDNDNKSPSQIEIEDSLKDTHSDVGDKAEKTLSKLGSIIEDRDNVLQKLSMLKLREDENDYTGEEKEYMKDVSKLEENLNELLKGLDDKLVRYKSTSPQSEGGSQKDFLKVMENVEAEIDKLERELQDGRVFLYMADEDEGRTLLRKEDDDEKKEMLVNDIIDRIQELEEKKRDVLTELKEIEGGGNDDKEIEQNRTEILEALKEMEEKLDDLRRKGEIEELLKGMKLQEEGEYRAEDGEELLEDFDQMQQSDLKKRLEDIDETIVEYAIALEEELNKKNNQLKNPTLHGVEEDDENQVKPIIALEEVLKMKNNQLKNPTLRGVEEDDENQVKPIIALEEVLKMKNNQLKNPTLNGLEEDDEQQVKSIVKEKLSDLIDKRTELNKAVTSLTDNPQSKENLQRLVDRRKHITEALNKNSLKLEDNDYSNKVAEEIADSRKEYIDATQLRMHLRKKLEAIDECMKDIEDFDPDSTSGYSELHEPEKQNQKHLDEIEAYAEQIHDLKKVLDNVNEEKDNLEKELKLAEQKFGQLEEEIEERDSLLREKETQILELMNDAEELNNTTEALLELVQDLKEETKAKSLENELSKDAINDLEKKLMELEKNQRSDDEDRLDNEARENLLADIQKLEIENKECLSNIDAKKKELEDRIKAIVALEERVKELEQELGVEQMKNKVANEELEKLEQLRRELQKKGKRTVKLEDESFQDLRADMRSADSSEDESLSDNYLKHEMDRISATEEVMKLAAELIAENDLKTQKQTELFKENEELARMVEDLLEKCEVKDAELDHLKGELENLEDELKKLKSKYEEIADDNKIKMRMLEEKNDIIEEINNAKNELSDKLAESINDNDKYAIENKELHIELKQLQNEIERLMKIQDKLEIQPQVADLSEDIKVEEERSLMLRPEDSKREFVGLEKEELLKQANDDRDKLRNEKKNLEESIANLKEDLDKKDKEMILLKKNMEDSIANLEEDLDRKDKEMILLKKSFENRIANLKEDLVRKDKELNLLKKNLEEDLNSKDNEMILLKKNLEDSIANLEDLNTKDKELILLQEKYAEAKKQTEEAEEYNEVLQEEMKKYKREKAKLERELKGLEDLVEDKNDLIDSKSRESNHVKNERLKLKEEKERIDKEKADLKNELSLVSKQKRLLADEVESLNKELKNCKEKNKEMRAEYEEKIKELMKEVDAMKSELSKKVAELRQLRNSAEMLDDDSREQAKIFENKFRKLKQELDDERQAHEEVLRNFDRLKKAKEGIIADYDKRLQGVMDEKRNLQNLVTEQRMKLEDKEAENAMKTQKIDYLKKKVAELNKDLEEEKGREDFDLKLGDIRKLEEEIEEANQQLRRLQRKIKSAEKEHELEMEEKEEEIRRLAADIKKKNTKIEELIERQRENHKGEMERRNVDQLKEELEKMTDEIRKLKRKMKEREMEHEAEMEEWEEDKKRLNAEIRRKTAKMKELEAREKSKQDESDMERKASEKMGKQLHEHQAEHQIKLAKLKGQLNGLNNELKKKNDLIAEIKAAGDMIKHEEDLKLRKAWKIEAELEEKDEELRNLKKMMKEAEEQHGMEMKQNDREIKRILEDLKKKQDEMEELKKTERIKRGTEDKNERELLEVKEELGRRNKELNNLKKTLQELESEHKVYLQRQEGEGRRLSKEAIKRDNKIAELMESEKRNKEELKEQAAILKEMKRNEKRGQADLNEKIEEFEAISNKYEHLKSEYNELERNSNDKIIDLQKMNREIKKELNDKIHELESERFRNRISLKEVLNSKDELEKQVKNKKMVETRMQKEVEQLKLDKKDYQNEIEELKAKNKMEKQRQELKVINLKENNALLQNEVEGLEREVAVRRKFEEEFQVLKEDYQRQRFENDSLKKKFEEMTEMVIDLKREVVKWKEEYERIKAESEVVMKYSANLKAEMKKLNEKQQDKMKEYKKEKKLLIENLEEEFRKNIEEMMKSHLADKEEMLRMWDEDRENWEREIEDQMKKSRQDCDRKLKEQRDDLQKEYKKEKDEELQAQNMMISKKYEEEKLALETRYDSEKHYMTNIIQELIQSLLRSKTNKLTMKRNHTNEVTKIEEKYDTDKVYLEMCKQQEIMTLEEKLNQAFIKELIGVSQGSFSDKKLEETLDLIPRKLT